MEKTVSKDNKTNVLLDLLFILRKNFLWMLIIVIAATSIGIGYAYLRKPEYLANQEINYYVKEEGSTEDSTPTTVEINTMNRYIDTMVDFCSTEKVLDLANAYYVMFRQQTDDIQTFIAKAKNQPTPEVSYRGEDSHYSASKVKTYSFEKDANMTGFVFGLSYQDSELQKAQDKVQILALACYKEAQDFIPGITTYLSALGFDKGDYTVDLSKTRIVIVSFAIGVAAAAVFVFLRNLLDNSIKTKEDLEKLTGAAVFACIEDRDELANNAGKANVKEQGGTK